MRMVSPKGGCCLGVNCWVEIDSSANCAAIPINAYVGADILSSGDSQDVMNKIMPNNNAENVLVFFIIIFFYHKFICEIAKLFAISVVGIGKL